MSRHLFVAAAAMLVINAGPAGATSRSTIQRVVVYSDQARVFREARVTLAGKAVRLELARLPGAARPASVQVACPTGRVQKVELVQDGGPPRKQGAAQKSVELARLQGQRRLLLAEERIMAAEVSFIRTLRLQPAADKKKKGEAFSVDAWRTILRWQDARLAAAHKRLAELAVARQGLDQKIRALSVGRPPRSEARSTRVMVTLSGRPGPHRLVLSYLVGQVSWRPSYDLRHDAARGKVQASYHAVVRQRSGEDWSAARLAFSTARPRSSLRIPRLSTWTIGRRRDFSPGPRLVPEPAPRVWRPETARRARISARLDRVLAARQERKQRAAARPLPPGEQRTLARGLLTRLGSIMANVTATARRARQDKDIIKLNCVNDKLVQLKGSEALVRLKMITLLDPASTLAQRDAATTAATVAYQKAIVLSQEADACIGEDIAYVGATRVEVQVAPDAARRSRRPPPPVRRLPWIDAVYRAPTLDPDSPAGAARGYLFTIPSPGRHSVPSTGKPLRVPLLSVGLAARPVHRILPGLSRSSYVMATVRNSTGRPMLRGPVNLFSGASFVGRSTIDTALPGRDLRLPLGVDDAVKVSRTMRQKTVEQGVLFKDDVTRYTVALEIANHHRRSITVELLDQVPLARGEKVEVKGLRYFVAGKAQRARPPGKGGRPGWTSPDARGRVRWRGKIGPASVRRLAFSFTIVRPRGHLLSQNNGGAR